MLYSRLCSGPPYSSPCRSRVILKLFCGYAFTLRIGLSSTRKNIFPSQEKEKAHINPLQWSFRCWERPLGITSSRPFSSNWPPRISSNLFGLFTMSLVLSMLWVLICHLWISMIGYYHPLSERPKRVFEGRYNVMRMQSARWTENLLD